MVKTTLYTHSFQKYVTKILLMTFYCVVLCIHPQCQEYVTKTL